ncbi:dTDP-glucose 4,6-dehydratase [Candidatus Pacearchaeota archaeon CG_4_9_14_0_2_um_filter_39_13]|nr:dTDP-glucose 4,6-dehydratase [Candidatus Pacearchaeota archaeon]PJC44251.1 MAG: dTDP-glucose 4,6-dehydratase [Candidatus Pacearchaeota archaeon CG_4_9_14_0_2_um_filter_39_13]
MENKLIVTGGYGFIGSNFIKYIMEKYPFQKVVNIDKVTYSGNPKNLNSIENNENYEFIKADIIDDEQIEDLINESDTIVNFAAESHVDNSIKNPKEFIRTNILGVHNLLEIARKKKARLFVQISTDEVYGSLKIDDKSSKEGDILEPSSPYSASKAAAEMLCRANIRTFNQPIIITRSSNNFGPYQFPEKVIPLFITNLIEGGKIPLYGKGQNIRDWIYVLDHCEAIDFIIKNGSFGEIYNIGGGNEIKNIDLTRKILKNLKKDNSWIEEVADRLGHDLRYSLDCNKIRNLGWKPKFNFDDALKKTIKWYNGNSDWWKPLKGRKSV